ncbi:hypothetical protein [Aliidiomarina sanyensis]|uniref:Uncharacterized protein n=1 Tax=Aliidiomarina sanyensis TaxID=1249555 RepID=A0A432WCP5_9GAMM|nr:hypothetical protein [Aliidiomarina sanyensis]RUO29502.1 hypothetical protein CWE11_09650 [Aliidiomarina sanyensis]
MRNVTQQKKQTKRVHHTLAASFLGLALSGTLVVQAQSANAATESKPLPFFFSDCSHLLFDSHEGEELTRSERIAILNADIQANVGNYEACMEAALSSSQQRMRAAANVSQSNQSGSDQSSAAQSEQASTESQETALAQQAESQQETTEQDQRETSESSRAHQGSDRRQGTTAVCDAILTGLDSATTESEKAHFEALAKEYGC